MQVGGTTSTVAARALVHSVAFSDGRRLISEALQVHRQIVERGQLTEEAASEAALADAVRRIQWVEQHLGRVEQRAYSECEELVERDKPALHEQFRFCSRS